MTYNVHSCVGMDGQHSPQRIAEVIAEIDPDVACLQELDLQRPRTACAAQAQVIAEQLAMQFHFHPIMCRSTEQYGDAILTRHPLRLRRAAAFPEVPRPFPREARGAIWVETAVAGVTWQIVNTHFGLGREERRLQAAALARDWIEPARQQPPAVVCGDFNSRSGSAVHGILTRHLSDVCRLAGVPAPRTFSTRLPFVCLDYFFVSPGVVVREARAVFNPRTKIASDHFPLVAELDG